MTLSDRIAVMNDGRLAQVGTPTEVFEDPANTFVAKFIGSPNMNFLTSSVEEVTDDALTLSIGGGNGLRFAYELDEGTDVDSLPDEVILGFRPHRVEVSSTAGEGIEGTVELNESIGDEVIQYLDGPQGELRAIAPVRDVVDEGELVTLRIPTSAIHVFDAESGDHLLRGERTSDWADVIPSVPQ